LANFLNSGIIDTIYS